jgi:alpha-beta hydrolase superfamily lysophospholipase
MAVKTLTPMRIILAGVALLLFLPDVRSAADAHLQRSTTKEGIAFGWVGDLPSKPAPTVFFLGGAIEDSLTQPHYLEAVDALGAGVWCVTIDLPSHGRGRRPGEPTSLAGWRFRFEHNEDVTADFVREASAVLDHLIAQKYTDPARVAVFGTSRGGFMAFHFAAVDPRVSQVAGFSPVTDLFALSEFAGLANDRLARARSAALLVDKLRDRGIWLTIGSTDQRVGTRAVFDFVERVIAAAEAIDRQPGIELHVQTTEGHAVPVDAYKNAAHWLRRAWSLPASDAERIKGGKP